MGKIEDVVTELKSLSRLKPLKDAQLARFKELCIQLRKNGFTNSEISQLTGGSHSPVTIKEYTRGVKSTNASRKEELLSSFSKLIEGGGSVEDVRQFVSQQEQLAKKGTSISAVSDFMLELEARGIEADGIASIKTQLESLAKNGTSIERVVILAQYASELRKMGLQPSDVKVIYDAAKKYGGSPNKIIEAVNVHADLHAIQRQAAEATSKMQEARQGTMLAQDQLLAAETRKERIQKDIYAMDKLRKLGYTDDDFITIHELTATMGGQKQVLAALKAYSSVDQLAAKAKGLREEGDELTRKNENLKHENMHLLTAISVCRNLIFKYDFSEQAIINVYQMAGKYGNPASVMAALEKYGSTQAFDSEIKGQLLQIEQNKAALKEQQRQEAELRGRVSSLASSLHQAQELTLRALKERSSEAIDQITSAYTDSIVKVMNIMQRYKEMEAKAEVHKQELQIARIALGTNLPGAIHEMPPQIAQLLIEASARFCKEKRIDPQVSPPRVVTVTQPHLRYATLSLGQVLAWATSGVREYMQAGLTNSGGLPA